MKQKGGKKGGAAVPDRPVDISRLDIRVGEILSAEKVHVHVHCTCTLWVWHMYMYMYIMGLLLYDIIQSCICTYMYMYIHTCTYMCI